MSQKIWAPSNVRKEPETFCWTFIMRTSRSTRLLSKGMRSFLRKMSALSARRHVLRSILGCSGPIFHDVGRFAMHGQAARLTLVGPAATACRGARREGQRRIELCYCRGVTGRERRCQDAGKSAVTFLLGAAQFQNLRLCGYRAFWNRVAIVVILSHICASLSRGMRFLVRANAS